MSEDLSAFVLVAWTWGLLAATVWAGAWFRSRSEALRAGEDEVDALRVRYEARLAASARAWEADMATRWRQTCKNLASESKPESTKAA